MREKLKAHFLDGCMHAWRDGSWGDGWLDSRIDELGVCVGGGCSSFLSATATSSHVFQTSAYIHPHCHTHLIPKHTVSGRSHHFSTASTTLKALTCSTHLPSPTETPHIFPETFLAYPHQTLVLMQGGSESNRRGDTSHTKRHKAGEQTEKESANQSAICPACCF